MSRSLLSSRRTIAALVAGACLLPALALYGQSAPPAPPAPGAPGASMQRPGQRWEHPMHDRMERELGRFKASLRLDARQSALWDQAAMQMKPRGDQREEMKAHHDQVTGMLDDPNFDPRKLAAMMDQDQARRMAEMKTKRDAWIAVYESLNPVQRGQVREFLRERMAGHHEHGGPMGGGPGWHHPDGDGGPAGAAPKG